MEKYIIWGVGNQGKDLYELFKEAVIIEAFIDNNPDLINTTYNNIRIISFKDYLNLEDKLPIIISQKYTSDIVQLLEDNNIDNYILASDLLYNLYDTKKFVCASNYFVDKEYKIMFEWIINAYKKLLKDYFCFKYLNIKSKQWTDFKNMDFHNIKCPIINESSESINKAYEIILRNKLNFARLESLPEKADFLVVHGMKINFILEHLVMEAEMRNIPIVFSEDGFIRSIVPYKLKSDMKYKLSHAAIFDDKGVYIYANGISNIEAGLNSDFQLSNEQRIRASKVMRSIIDNKISKYNHQPFMELKVGNPERKKVLVIDQVYGDMSIEWGWADDQSFDDMLKAAINENPNADILVKTHPESSVAKGYFTHLENKGNIYKIDFAINPISLLEQVDKVYVCTSQMGFEALMCGKEVHVFGMPFYAGWGVTHDRMKCPRRIKTRSIEEIFYIAYIMCTIYVSHKTNSVCEIEQVIDDILELRDEYFNNTMK